MVSAQQLFFSPHKGKYMQTPPGAERNLPPLGLAGQRKVEGALQGPRRSPSVAASDQFPGLVDGGLSPNPADVTVPPAACLESPCLFKPSVSEVTLSLQTFLAGHCLC